MSLASQIDLLATAIGQKIKAVQVHQLVCTIALDPLVVGTGIMQLTVMRACTITGVRASVAVGKAPTGASVIFDVNKNAVTIFTTQGNRPTIVASATKNAALAVPDVTSLAAGDVLTVDVDQIGSTLAGSLAVITIGVY
jgi:hypothetical protein